MLHISEKDIYRDGTKIGWIEDTHVFAVSGNKVGYISGNDIFAISGTKAAYLSGDKLTRVGHDTPIHIEEVNKQVTGGTFSEIQRSATFVFFS